VSPINRVARARVDLQSEQHALSAICSESGSERLPAYCGPIESALLRTTRFMMRVSLQTDRSGAET
jgi:hypothetical protein